MGMMDDVKGKMSDMGDEMKERVEMLKNKKQQNPDSMTDSERDELKRWEQEHGDRDGAGE